MRKASRSLSETRGTSQPRCHQLLIGVASGLKRLPTASGIGVAVVA